MIVPTCNTIFAWALLSAVWTTTLPVGGVPALSILEMGIATEGKATIKKTQFPFLTQKKIVTFML